MIKIYLEYYNFIYKIKIFIKMKIYYYLLNYYEKLNT